MKRIVTALANSTLNDELKKYAKYDVLTDDIVYQEGVIDYVSQNETDVIIISSLLQGSFSLIEFVSELKETSMLSRIIVIVENISDEERNVLLSKGVFDILYDESADINDVLEAIDREAPINYQAQLKNEVNKLKEKIEQDYKSNVTDITSFIKAIQKQEVISVFGTPGSGKSTVVGNLVKSFCKKTNAKILLIDLDTMNGNLDEILQVSKIPSNVELIMDEDKKCGLNYAADLSIKNRFDTNVLDEIIIDCGGFDLLSGNTSLHYCQNTLNAYFYDYLLKCAKEKYDFIFLDLSSNLFLDSTKWGLKESTAVLFVTENSNICLKKSIQILDVVFNVWNVYKEKFKLILNRVSSSGIDEDIFANICNLKLVGKIKNDMAIKSESYDKVLESLNYVPKKSVITKIKEGSKMLSSAIMNVHL